MFDTLKLLYKRGIYTRVSTLIFAFYSTLLTFFTRCAFCEKNELWCCIAVLVVIIVFCCVQTFRYFNSRNILLVKENSSIQIEVGDIFKQPKDVCIVIPFNEFFDTKVDDIIVSSNTLHGKFIEKFKADSIMDIIIKRLESVEHLSIDNNRANDSNNKRYQLGIIIKIDDFYKKSMDLNNVYLLTSFSKFDEDSRAYLHYKDYLHFLITFLDNIDKNHQGYTVAIPVFGGGMTRGLGDKQKCLETILLCWQCVASQYKFKLKLVVAHKDVENYNFAKIKCMFYDLLK